MIYLSITYILDQRNQKFKDPFNSNSLFKSEKARNKLKMVIRHISLNKIRENKDE